MSVLDRVKLFLPALKQANLELEAKLKEDGGASAVQIDHNLCLEGKDDAGALADAGADCDGSSDNEDLGQKPSVPVVNLEFALGDFDGVGSVLEAQEEVDDDDDDGGGDDEEEEVAEADALDSASKRITSLLQSSKGN